VAVEEPIPNKSRAEMADAYIDLIKQRRTCYPLTAESLISDERIKYLAGEVIKSSRTSFNCRATRYLILLHSDHVKFWQIAKDAFKGTLSTKQYEAYEGKLDSHQAGYGTVSTFPKLRSPHNPSII
jgi:predicted oxidoreductase (fatty acid repression mutant protein)